LLEVARCIAEEVKADGDDSTLGLELTSAFQARVMGCEILTAPFAIAQLQLYLLLESLGAKPKKDGRLAMFLTNALSGWHDTGDVKLNFTEMRDEYHASQKVKRTAQIIVILGNPPYDRFAGAAQAEEAELVANYKGVTLIDDVDRKTRQTKLDEFGRPKKKQKGQSALYTAYGVRKQLLDDLYIRARLGEERIGIAADYRIVSYISNSSYLTGRSHPLMRESLLTNFHKVWIDNLNGDKYRTGKLIPQGPPRRWYGRSKHLYHRNGSAWDSAGHCHCDLAKTPAAKVRPWQDRGSLSRFLGSCCDEASCADCEPPDWNGCEGDDRSLIRAGKTFA